MSSIEGLNQKLVELRETIEAERQEVKQAIQGTGFLMEDSIKATRSQKFMH